MPASGTKLDGTMQWLWRLTRREDTIFRLIAHGRSNQEIAEELGIEKGAVENNIGRIYSKLGLHGHSSMCRVQTALIYWFGEEQRPPEDHEDQMSALFGET